MTDCIVAFTGHRSNKLGGWKLPNPTYVQVCRETEALLKRLNPVKCISGMALGYDSFAASVCIRLGLPFVAAVPFDGQDKVWPEASKQAYKRLLDKAAEVVIVSPGGYSPAKMQTRNEWMVDRATDIVACWDGSKGGTGNCVAYAEKLERPIHRIIPIIGENK